MVSPFLTDPPVAVIPAMSDVGKRRQQLHLASPCAFLIEICSARAVRKRKL
jgi:hypothetical protein